MTAAVALTELEPMREPRRVPIANISLDSEYQRNLETLRVQRMVRNWNTQRCSPLLLSARGGRLWCIDGQHRLAAMKELAMEFCYATVLEGLTKIQEADLFVATQADRKSLNAWDLWKAEKVANHEEVLAIVRVVQKYRFTLSLQAGFNNIAAIGALRRIYRLGGETLLGHTLEAVGAFWAEADGQNGSVSRQGIILYGLAIFLHSFRDQPQYDSRRMQTILRKNSPDKFLRAAQTIAANRLTAQSSAVNVAEAIRNAYNVGIGAERKLDVIRQTRRSPKRK